jgi:hypothetical protein
MYNISYIFCGIMGIKTDDYSSQFKDRIMADIPQQACPCHDADMLTWAATGMIKVSRHFIEKIVKLVPGYSEPLLLFFKKQAMFLPGIVYTPVHKIAQCIDLLY